MSAWPCDKCTLENEASADSCAACKSPKPVDGDAPWQCPRCTFVNAAGAHCSMCGGGRGDAPGPRGSDEPSSEGRRWPCRKCDYCNRPSQESCAMCGCSRGDESSWQCGRCTLLNDSDRRKCIVCKAKRPQEGADLPAAPVAAPVAAAVGSPTPDREAARRTSGALASPARAAAGADRRSSPPTPGTPGARRRGSAGGGAGRRSPDRAGRPSSLTSAVPDTPPDGRLCPRCTFLNGQDWTVCGACELALLEQQPSSTLLRHGTAGLESRAESWLIDRQGSVPETLDAQLVSMQDKVAAIEAQVGSGKWTDPDFPASAESLGPVRRGEYKWRRADDVDKPVRGSWELAAEVDGVLTLSTDAMSQGELGDCWFLSALSVVCMRPDLASRLLISQAVSKQGVYCLRFWKDGVWTPVFVDDQFPVVRWGALAFAKTKGCNQLWPSLVEKAFAKLHGSYAAIESGNASEAFAALTGAPCESIDLSPSADLDTDVVWSRMISSLECGSLLAAACGQDGMERSSRQLGLVTSHSYSVQNVLIGPRGVRLVRLRNPWGSTEWKGAWGDHDDRNWTAELRREYQSQQVLDDGVFHMSFPDFLTHFRSVCICHAYEGWFSDSRECSFSKRFHPTGLTAQFSRQYVIETTQPTWLFLSVVQQSKRGHRLGDAYKYKDVGLFVVKGTPKAEDVEGQQPVAAMFANDKRISTCEVMLSEPGKYVALPYSLLNTADDTPYSIAVWASKPFTLDAVTRPSVRSITHAAHVCMRSPVVPGLGVKVKEDHGIRVHSLNSSCGMWYMVENTNDAGGYHVTLTHSFSGVRGLEPSRGSFTTKDVLVPGERQITVILTAVGSWGMSGSSSSSYSSGRPPPVRHEPALPSSQHLHEVMKGDAVQSAPDEQRLASFRARRRRR